MQGPVLSAHKKLVAEKLAEEEAERKAKKEKHLEKHLVCQNCIFSFQFGNLYIFGRQYLLAEKGACEIYISIYYAF